MRNSNSRGTSFWYPRQTLHHHLYTKPINEDPTSTQKQHQISIKLNIIQTPTYQYPINKANLVN